MDTLFTIKRHFARKKVIFFDFSLQKLKLSSAICEQALELIQYVAFVPWQKVLLYANTGERGL